MMKISSKRLEHFYFKSPCFKTTARTIKQYASDIFSGFVRHKCGGGVIIVELDQLLHEM